jgi:linoleoyl-CoA desaturase
MHNPPRPIQFQKDTDFFRSLQSKVFEQLKQNSSGRYAPWTWYLKATGLLSIYALSFGLLFSWIPYGQWIWVAYALLGFCTTLIGLNIGHDAAHDSISRHAWVNTLFLWSFDLLGANAQLWKLRHIYGHHPYPNIKGYDTDIQAEGIVRIYPKAPFWSIHRWQHWYTPFLMLFCYTQNWLLWRDFMDFRRRVFGRKQISRHNTLEKIKLIFFKSLHLVTLVVLPLLLGATGMQVLAGFLVLHACAGMVITVALVAAHVGTSQAFPEPSASGHLPHSWAEHQLATTCDFCTENPLMNFLLGGFNHHVAHHLFPGIHHSHYHWITPLVKNTAMQYGLQYHCEQSFFKVFKAHLTLLRRNGADWDGDI